VILCDKRDDFDFPIVNFSFICSTIPAASAYWVHISQLKRYSRACGSHQDILDRGLLLRKKLLNQRNHYGISLSQMTTDMFQNVQFCPFILDWEQSVSHSKNQMIPTITFWYLEIQRPKKKPILNNWTD